MPTTSTTQTWLFTVRLWKEEIDINHFEWRGTVQRLDTGERHHFRKWEELISFFPLVDGKDDTEKPV